MAKKVSEMTDAELKKHKEQLEKKRAHLSEKRSQARRRKEAPKAKDMEGIASQYGTGNPRSKARQAERLRQSGTANRKRMQNRVARKKK